MINIRTSSLNNSPLLQCFHSFYYEILRLKERALRYGESDVQRDADESYSQTTINRVEEIQTRLKLTLEELGISYARITGGVSAALFQDAQYIMVVLADEIFLNLAWVGAKEWRLSLLEGQIFQTQIAGELFFKKIDALFDAHNATRYELGQLYLMALSLGFRGHYRTHDTSNRVHWYQDQLYKMCCQDPTYLFSATNTKALFPECYAHTLNESPGRGLPDLRTWGIYGLCVFLIYIFVSYIVWYRIAFEMHRDLYTIFAQTVMQRPDRNAHGR